MSGCRFAAGTLYCVRADCDNPNHRAVPADQVERQPAGIPASTIGDSLTDGAGHRYIETLHGPMVWGTCVGCGRPALEVADTSDVERFGPRTPGGGAEARCDKCGRVWHGADLDYYGTGRDELYQTVVSPELDRLRILANEAAARRDRRDR